MRSICLRTLCVEVSQRFHQISFSMFRTTGMVQSFFLLLRSVPHGLLSDKCIFLFAFVPHCFELCLFISIGLSNVKGFRIFRFGCQKTGLLQGFVVPFRLLMCQTPVFLTFYNEMLYIFKSFYYCVLQGTTAVLYNLLKRNYLLSIYFVDLRGEARYLK